MGENCVSKFLYRLYVVSKSENIIMDGKVVVGKDKREAEFNAEVDVLLRKMGLTYDDVTVIPEKIGSFRVEDKN